MTRILLFVAGLGLLVSCSKNDMTCICPADFDPVCGSDGLTYSNACQAECAGVTWSLNGCPETADMLLVSRSDCGFLLVSDQGTFKPDSIPSNFGPADTLVRVTYLPDIGIFNCQNAVTFYSEIEVIEIR